MKYNYIFGILIFLYSCASVPTSTVTLTQEVIKEAADMHQLNLSLIDQLFEERQEKINLFVEHHYTPALLKTYEALLPDSLNYKQELPNILKSIIPVINRKKDSLQNVLDTQKQNLVKQLNTNYSEYSKATTSLQNLINSIVKVQTTEREALVAIEKLTGDHVDFKKVEASVNTILDTTGQDFNKILQVKKIINQK